MQMKNIFIAIALILLFCSIQVGAQTDSGIGISNALKRHLDTDKTNKELKKSVTLPPAPLLRGANLKSFAGSSSQKNFIVEDDKKSECSNKVARHIGFDAIGKNVTTTALKKDKILETIVIDLNNAETIYKDGIPMHCLQMLDVTVEKDKNNKKISDVFDLKVSQCSRNPKYELGRLLKVAGNIFKKDPNSKNNIKKFSFNPNEDHTYLKHTYLQGLYTSNGLLDSDGVKEINKKLAKAGCNLKKTKDSGNNIDDYINCGDNIKSSYKIKQHLAKELVDECAVAYGNSAVDSLSFFSSDEKQTKEQNIEQLNSCITKNANTEVPKSVDLQFDLDPKPKLKTQGDDFITYDKNCEQKPLKDVVNDLVISEELSDITKQYTDDYATCHDCQGVKILDDSKVEFFKKLGDPLSSACFADINGGFVDSVAKSSCGDKKLSCSTVKDIECAKELKLPEGGLIKTSDYESLISSTRDEIDLKYVMPVHKIFSVMTGEKNKNRSIDDATMAEFKSRLTAIRKCVEDPEKLKYLMVVAPQPQGKYLHEKLSSLRTLVNKLSAIKDDTTAADLKTIAGNKSILESFKSYASNSKALYKLSKEEMEKKLQGDDCSSLSFILGHPLACEISEKVLKSSGDIFQTFADTFEDGVAEKLEKHKEKVREEKSYPSSVVEQMASYIKFMEKGFTAKSQKEMVTLMALHEDISGKTKDMNLPCESYSSSLSASDITRSLGKKGSKLTNLADEKGAVASGKEDEAKERITALEEQVTQLQSQNTSLQQQLQMALSQIQGGGMAGSGMYANAMLGGFSEFTNALSQISGQTTNALMGSFQTYTQSFNKMSSDFSQQLYNMHNTSMNGMLYSQQMYMQSMQMSQPPSYGPYGGMTGII